MIFKRSGRPAPVEWLIVGLGNPGERYSRTRHNVGELAARQLIERFDLAAPKARYGGKFTSGRAATGGPRIAVLIPETFMNESGRAVAPARGELKLEPERVIAIHDEIDFEFGRIEPKLGGGHGGHNGVRSIKSALGGADFWRVRVGVGRPESTDPEIVSSFVLGRFSEGDAAVARLIDDAVAATLRLLEAPSAAN